MEDWKWRLEMTREEVSKCGFLHMEKGLTLEEAFDVVFALRQQGCAGGGGPMPGKGSK